MKILFVCHGNICRSPMAEFVFSDLLRREGVIDSFTVASMATSNEEIGNPIYPPVRELLEKKKIPYNKNKRATKLTASDYDKYDMIIGMDNKNMRNMNIIFGTDKDRKLSMLMSYAGKNREVSDPWYTGEYESVYHDILAGCEGLLSHLLKK